MRNEPRLVRLERAEARRRALRDAKLLAERYGVGEDDAWGRYSAALACLEEAS
ncbi:MAG: hypothetical protein U1B78_02600 [Dehalococcoidia bacterium]|nr:hypothetical protein [Dehalococcoidia bacterium]MDZ4278009.1 hypothetical protein [Dehalococcoidia bacterium]